MDNGRDLSDRWRPRPDLRAISRGRGAGSLTLPSPLGEEGRRRAPLCEVDTQVCFEPFLSGRGVPS